ncbi:MAG: 2-C-methyl-D-erythritol 2,4-cyclodiphosphate synthase [Ruminococcaceae bacterium]|nr:2-C-methyl-D-erythritol 2,4-cyclodiphosphate synthase [Oscillospiraceae bacterium]
MQCNFRIGHGYDVHRFATERKLILGGVEIPYEMGLLGHSDADVLCHALMDALLGAAALGDIGKHFPDSDAKYKGISSLLLLQHVKELLDEKGYGIVNADVTVIAQKPKLAPHIPQMVDNIKKILDCDNINIKATTEEGLGFTGRLEGISAHSVALLSLK